MKILQDRIKQLKAQLRDPEILDARRVEIKLEAYQEMLIALTQQTGTNPLVSGSLLSEKEIEPIIDKELEKLNYSVTGDKTADFVDGFIRGYEYAHGIRLQ